MKSLVTQRARDSKPSLQKLYSDNQATTAFAVVVLCMVRACSGYVSDDFRNMIYDVGAIHESPVICT